MNIDQSENLWLELQGEAFGRPGLEPRWTSSTKDAVGTAYSGSSRVWFTCSHGILNEIYHPTIDRPQMRDMGFLITDGESFVHEEKRDLVSEFEYIHPDTLGVRYINSDRQGRYRLIKEIITDPHRAVVLQHIRIEADDELLRRLKVYALLAPHLGGGGAGNSARALDVAGHKVLIAWKDPWALAMGSSCGFSRVSCGFVGQSDGWRDLMEDFRMDWEFGSATDGNVALFGELNLANAIREEGALAFDVAIGFGDGLHTAIHGAVSALVTGFEQHRKRFIEQWLRVGRPQRLAARSGDGGKLMRTSHSILLAHEDKTYSGAFVASASIPWGESKGDDDLGGYHLVWTRDMVETATALFACGSTEAARRALVYLACTQQPDGGFAQNFWIDGTPYWRGLQLDEVAFPLILAWRLWNAKELGQMDIFPFVERAAGFLVKQGPITNQERWEENAGYSPSTLAAVISGLICAAEIVRTHGSEEVAIFLEEYADWIEKHLEDWTVTNNGVLDPEVKRHYMRIKPPECGEAYAHEDCGKETIRLANQPPGSRTVYEAREIIDGGFLELVRYGVRRADDPLIVDTLKVVDAVLKRDLPQGRGWLRYNHDGYGQTADCKPFEGWGQGRVWPLLTGERAHYELAAGNGYEELVRTYEEFATCGNLLAEQVWDGPVTDGCGFALGQPADSAVPLVWAHSEYLKLLRSAVDGKVFDRIDTVHERYSNPQSDRKRRRDLEIYIRRRPIQHVSQGDTLRIIDGKYFTITWTDDGWKTVNNKQSRSLGSAGFSADIAPKSDADALEWTLYFPDEDAWLGYNVRVKVDAI
jgi:glucoamylase